MADQEPQDREKRLRDFCEMCSASEEMALQYLEAHDWDLVAACNSYFADEDDTADGTLPSLNPDEPYTGPRTLDGRPAPQVYRRNRAPASQPKKKGVATLGSLGAGSHQHGDGDDDEDDDFDGDGADDGRGNLFAGGEKSGLAVQDPQKEGGSKGIINDILAKARASNASRPDTASDAGPSRLSRFRGTGMTLGGEGVESRAIPDPLGLARPASSQPQERVLHIWQDGFSIDDGELRRFDDPANQADLQMIRSGRAPLHLMNVQHDQPIDVKLHQHDTPYAPPPKSYKPFSGAGHRLGSPVPAGTTSTAAASSSSNAEPSIDTSQPTIMLRIQMPDGTRLPARFNTTNTVGEVYGFVQGASPETRSRAWVLVTTFPNKEHTDKNLVLGEMPEFKKGGTAVVKWA
ncbi:SEP domain-containing protein [Hirsutella rhossiliensis]|uniref:SEP domain-containing protein n=1 Tax=Hirsutella rhossiliensis TaxID=111463 RepID=A0A9P8N6Q7_9HYPO|nr:SEP domain-containing protein [Hirsutella rhossiliensis]KAH0967997.1 SEP domain-containing protein [Hirsutella rhossiliensis]